MEKFKKPCSYPGCNVLVTSGRCSTHKKKKDQGRKTAAKRGYDGRWQRYRVNFLRKNPLCVRCMKKGRFTPATVVDHIKPHKGDKQLFWDTKNHQALCKKCHDQKTVNEDGGFGRPKK